MNHFCKKTFISLLFTLIIFPITSIFYQPEQLYAEEAPKDLEFIVEKFGEFHCESATFIMDHRMNGGEVEYFISPEGDAFVRLYDYIVKIEKERITSIQKGYVTFSTSI